MCFGVPPRAQDLFMRGCLKTPTCNITVLIAICKLDLAQRHSRQTRRAFIREKVREDVSHHWFQVLLTSTSPTCQAPTGFTTSSSKLLDSINSSDLVHEDWSSIQLCFAIPVRWESRLPYVSPFSAVHQKAVCSIWPVQSSKRSTGTPLSLWGQYFLQYTSLTFERLTILR